MSLKCSTVPKNLNALISDCCLSHSSRKSLERQVEPMVKATLPPLKLSLQDLGQFYHYVHRHSIKMLTAPLSSGSALGASRSLALRLRRCNYWKVSLDPPSTGNTLGLQPVPYRENRRERPGRCAAEVKRMSKPENSPSVPGTPK